MKENQEGLRKVRRALLSVSDKTGIVELAEKLRGFDVEIISTGGTSRALREAGIEVRDISAVTDFPEMMDGRVKTLHPRIHGGLLALRDNEEHLAAMREYNIEPIDMVVVNLYPFEETVEREGVMLEEAIEQIDIGGPSMIRSAAKNFRDVAVVVSPSLYRSIVAEMEIYQGALSFMTRMRLALHAFAITSSYDGRIFKYLSKTATEMGQRKREEEAEEFRLFVGGAGGAMAGGIKIPLLNNLQTPPAIAQLRVRKKRDLRYGENPHQLAALYDAGEGGGIAQAELLGGKEMSYNNYVDAEAAWQLVSDFDELTCAIIKHTNPAGVGTGAAAEEAYRRALETDPVSAFGGIVAFNRKVDERAARAVAEIFTEVVIAPDYEDAALEVLRAKKNLRVLRVSDEPRAAEGLEYRQISGGMLVQTRDTHRLKPDELKVVTRRQPTSEEMGALLFAWTVAKHTKSNAIVYARAGQTVGVGAGQMSRVDSVRIGAMRAQIPVQGSVLASDAFFPFRDGIDEAARHGITAIIQPGGSVRDAEAIAAADEHNLAMVFTGIRHFKH
ncbi:MAG: bifunctional phosphoribosylaminoimidazolecarboxamide formyltransferase/IMP cyclohydrolase [Pyrinomonadaceae bacterium]|nr:bifunctional phosphoribosylaminoimidazolecarboxamide formyltransferase/IMP cyclohydrolase [Pyrinomonadaceae bacterium]